MKPRATVRMLLRLYPRTWRDRYAEEMAAMLSDVSLTPGSILDIVAGAIDAHVAPQTIRGTVPAARPDWEKTMFTNIMKRCAMGADVTPHDRWLGSTVMIGLSAIFAVAYIVAAYMFRGSDLVDALGIMAFPAAMFLSMPFTYLKGHSRTSQVVIVGGCLFVLVGAALVAARI
jgi:hypothetical protein